MRKKTLLLTVSLFAALFCSVGAFTLYQRYIYKPDLTVIGFADMADGIGRQSVELVNAFKKEFSIGFVSTRPPKWKQVPEDVKKIIKNQHVQFGKVVIFEDMLWWPGENKYQKINTPLADDSIRIAYSMCESTQIPPEWVIILNTHFDAVVVPDKFLIEVYKNCGVVIPVFDLPLALDLEEFLQKPLKRVCGSPMVFGNLSVCSDRKNQIHLIRAFAKAFGNDPNVLLRINARYGEKSVINAITKEISDLGLKNIQFTQFCLDKNGYLELFQSIDCYVSISKGEGFSIQPREAMALGIPTIVTDNTAQSTICSSKLVTVISSSIEEAALYPWGDCYGHSFNCEIDDVANALRDVYSNYDAYLKHAADAREWAKQYQYENLKGFYRSIVRPKEVIQGNENKVTPEYLMTSSESLYKKYQNVK